MPSRKDLENTARLVGLEKKSLVQENAWLKQRLDEAGSQLVDTTDAMDARIAALRSIIPSFEPESWGGYIHEIKGHQTIPRLN